MTAPFTIAPSWVWTTIGAIADTSLGKMLDRAKSSGQNLKPYLRNINVQWGHIDESDILVMDIPPDQKIVIGSKLETYWSAKVGRSVAVQFGVAAPITWRSRRLYIEFDHLVVSIPGTCNISWNI